MARQASPLLILSSIRVTCKANGPREDPHSLILMSRCGLDLPRARLTVSTPIAQLKRCTVPTAPVRGKTCSVQFMSSLPSNLPIRLGEGATARRLCSPRYGTWLRCLPVTVCVAVASLPLSTLPITSTVGIGTLRRPYLCARGSSDGCGNQVGDGEKS